MRGPGGSAAQRTSPPVEAPVLAVSPVVATPVLASVVVAAVVVGASVVVGPPVVPLASVLAAVVLAAVVSVEADVVALVPSPQAEASRRSARAGAEGRGIGRTLTRRPARGQTRARALANVR